jgi:hypothetical protein
MASCTLELRVEAAQEIEDEKAAELQVLKVAEEVDLRATDDIFDCFLKTNMHLGRRLTEDEIMNTKSLPWRGDQARYERYSIPYLATLFCYGAFDKHTVNIKLNSNGFLFDPIVGANKWPHPRHKRYDWVVVPPALHSKFPRIKRFMRDHGLEEMRIFYHGKEQRMDVQLWAADTNTSPHVLITFEQGYPWVDERK